MAISSLLGWTTRLKKKKIFNNKTRQSNALVNTTCKLVCHVSTEAIIYFFKLGVAHSGNWSCLLGKLLGDNLTFHGGATPSTIMTFSITTLSIITFSIMDLIVTLSIMALCWHSALALSSIMPSVAMLSVAFIYSYAECHYAE